MTNRASEARARTAFVAIIVLIWLASLPAEAGQASVNWKNAPGIAASEVAVGTCAGGAYAADIGDAGDYARVPPDRDGALILRLKENETFCFRVRHVYPNGSASDWLFLGSKLIPNEPEIGPPVLPPPAPPTAGGVS